MEVIDTKGVVVRRDVLGETDRTSVYLANVQHKRRVNSVTAAKNQAT